MPATEPLGAPSSRSVSRLRRQAKHATDTNTASDGRTPSTGHDSTDHADMKKSSMDAAIDKVRERARKSVDERRGSDDSASQTRFSALLARKLKRKEKDKDNDSLGARNSTLVVDSGESGDLALSDTRSEGSLLDEDGHSSLLTDDGSDNDGYVLNIPFHSVKRICDSSSSSRCFTLQHIPSPSSDKRHLSIGMLQPGLIWPSRNASPTRAPSRMRTFPSESGPRVHALTCPGSFNAPIYNRCCLLSYSLCMHVAGRGLRAYCHKLNRFLTFSACLRT
jgi:hypothetical protein